jgi:hypothetical protein
MKSAYERTRNNGYGFVIKQHTLPKLNNIFCLYLVMRRQMQQGINMAAYLFLFVSWFPSGSN